jgi:murein DD-endopeptidase MepM/ murein hydrolase activator NlpD
VNSSLHPRRRSAISIRVAIGCVVVGGVVAFALAALWPVADAGLAEQTEAPVSSEPSMSVADLEGPATSIAVPSHALEELLSAEALPEVSLDVPSPVVHGRIRAGDSLVTALGRHGISASTGSQIAAALRPLFDFRNARPGDHYHVARDAEDRVIDFRYINYAEEVLELHWNGDEYIAQIEPTEYFTRRSRIAGVVDTSLYQAVESLGEKPHLATTFAQLFAWETDINGRAHPGDVFQAIYERRYRLEVDGAETYLGPGRILAARYIGDTSEHTAVYFAPEEERPGGYYRPDGTSLEREFLANPVELGRIASSWSAARFHPILKITRPHHGIDYAAPAGTPVWAAARGTVAYRGWSQGFGNLVKIRHDNGYLTYYGHLSAFAKDMKVGKRLQQKDVIGYVGSTGLATGPHVCFRVRKDGHYVNPLTLDAPAAAEVPKSDRVAFQAAMDDLLGTLGGQRLASAPADKSR